MTTMWTACFDRALRRIEQQTSHLLPILRARRSLTFKITSDIGSISYRSYIATDSIVLRHGGHLPVKQCRRFTSCTKIHGPHSGPSSSNASSSNPMPTHGRRRTRLTRTIDIIPLTSTTQSFRSIRALERAMKSAYLDPNAAWAIYCQIRKDPKAMAELTEEHFSWLRNVLHHQTGPIGPQSVVILCRDQRKCWRKRSAADEVAVGFEAEAAYLWSLYRLQAFKRVEQAFRQMQAAVEEAEAEAEFQRRIEQKASGKPPLKNKRKKRDSEQIEPNQQGAAVDQTPRPPGPQAWACLILSLAQLGDGIGAQSALNGMLQAGYRERPGLPLHIHVILGYLQSEQPFDAAPLYARLSQMPLDDPLLVNGPSLEPEEQTKMWNRLAGTLAKYNLTKQATELTQRMRREGIPLRLITQTTLVNSVARSRRVTSEVLTRLYSAMLASYPKMSMVAHTSFIEQFACRGDVVGAQRVLQRMIADGYKPDCFCYTSLMKAYARQNNLAAVWHVYRDMLVNRVELNVVTYTAMIRWFASVGDQESLSVCLREMRLRGVRPNVVTCNTLIWAAARLGDYRRASTVYRDMIRHGLTPDAFTYTWLFNASHPRALMGIEDEEISENDPLQLPATRQSSSPSFHNANWYQRGLLVLGWFRDMQQWGIRPARQSTYAVAMSTLLRANMYRGVLEVGDALIQHGITPSDYVFDMCRRARLRIDNHETSLNDSADQSNDSNALKDTPTLYTQDKTPTLPNTLNTDSKASLFTKTTATANAINSDNNSNVHDIKQHREHGRTSLYQTRVDRRRKSTSFSLINDNSDTATANYSDNYPSSTSSFTSSIIAQLTSINNMPAHTNVSRPVTGTFPTHQGWPGSTARACTLARPAAMLNAPSLVSNQLISRLSLADRIRIRRTCTLSNHNSSKIVGVVQNI